jgi:hypothetical protein
MTNNAEREGFESHIKSEWAKKNYPMGITDFSKHGVTGEYLKPMTEAAWNIWQARAQASDVPDSIVRVGGCKYTHSASVGHVYELFWLPAYKDKPLCDIDLYMCAASPTPPKSASVPVERLMTLTQYSGDVFGVINGRWILATDLAEIIAEYKS